MTKYMTKITYRKKYLSWHMISEGFSDCGREAMLASLLPDSLLHSSRSIWQRLLTTKRNKKPSQEIGRNQGPAYNRQRPAPSDLLQPARSDLCKAPQSPKSMSSTWKQTFETRTFVGDILHSNHNTWDLEGNRDCEILKKVYCYYWLNNYLLSV